MTSFFGGVGRLFAALFISVLVVPPVAALVAGLTLTRAPLPGELPEQRPNIVAVPSRVYDANGTQIGVYRGFDRSAAFDFDDIPPHVIEAVLSIEDRRFFEHDGIDYEGIARAARVNLELGEIAQGGSTITQQYIKNVYLSGERTFERKFREALLARELEQELSKEEILFRYLESTYFGAGAYGIGAAAQVYFDKPISEVNVSEAAMLAGVIRAPTSYSPRVDIEVAEERRLLVLQAMLDEGYLSLERFDVEAARSLWSETDGTRPSGPVTVIAAPLPKGATDHPYFVDWVEQLLIAELGPDAIYRDGLRIETSIDPELQEAAEAAVAERLENTEYPVEMSLVSIEPSTGHVLAMVGGRDYEVSQVNLGLGGSTGFQPGSSFKPIVLATAFTRGLGPETLYPAPGTWSPPGCSGPGCTIANYDYANRGEISLREATRASVNTVFAELVSNVSIDATVAMGRALGLDRLDPEAPYGASLALGAAESSPLEMASAYGTFANRGIRMEPVPIVRVVDADGNVLIDNRAPAGARVLSQAVADNLTDVLQGVVTGGTGRRAQVSGHEIAGKTGTTQSYGAAWFVGYSSEVTTAVWMGHADGLASLNNINGVGRVTGGSHPAIAFSDYMSVALADRESIPFPDPEPLNEIESRDLVDFDERDGTYVAAGNEIPSVEPDCNGPCEWSAVPAPAAAPVFETTPTTDGDGSTSTPTPATTPPTTPATTPTTQPSVPPTSAPQDEE